MNKEFIPYKQALEFKELGFNEECFAFYNKSEFHNLYFEIHINPDKWIEKKHSIYFIKAPLYQQAFKWLREKYNLFGEVELDCLKKLIEIAKNK